MRRLTLADLELFYKGYGGHPFVVDDIEVIKEAGAITTDQTPYYFNPIYGAYAWAQLNRESNAFGLLPKVTWSRSGWRVITDFANTLGTGGIAEDGSIPSATRPTVQVVKTTPKQVAHSFELSDIMSQLAEIGADDIYGSVDEMRNYFATEHARHINKMLMTDVDTPAGYNFESLDRVVSGYPESTLVSDATDVDIYGIDRHTSATWADATINHNGGTNRNLSDEIIRETLSNVKKAGGQPTVMLTGYDTYAKILGLYMNFVRYDDYLTQGNVQITVNGVETAEGIDAGVKVSCLYGIPIFTTQDAPVDGISRIYILDTSDPEGFGVPRLSFSVLRPTEYYETRDPFIAGGFKVKGVYRTAGEVVCRFMKAQAKIRDIV
ncbi:MAG: hypothetical protein DRN30_02725 [Thermoplasmata archaeon]|nr:MAG: hypothetical protein DRN30_02725 [Thermoplasmata archaeon]